MSDQTWSNLLTVRQARIAERLRLKSEALAVMYVGAAQLVAESDNPARGFFIAHATREIANRLPDVYGVIQASRVSADQLNELASAWRQEFPDRANSEGGLEPCVIGAGLCAVIARVVETHLTASEILNRDRPKELMEAARIVTGLGDSDPPPLAATALFQLSRAGVRVAHVNPVRPPPSVTDVEASFAELEYIVDAVLLEFYETMDDVDDLLREANRETDQ